jgi:hypothetical protein
VTRTRVLKRFAIAIAVACLSWTGVMMVAMPAASADTLSNGLTVTCNSDSAIHVTCVVSGCPRVNGDYVVDAVHAMINGGAQQEREYKCINGATARFGVDGDQYAPVNIGVQGCRKKDFEGDWCTPYANYTFTPVKPQQAPPPPPPQPVQCPAGSTTATVPAGQQCTAAPKPDVSCPADSPVKSVPDGQTCPPAPKVTDAIGATFNTGLGNLSVTVTNSSALPAKCTYDATGIVDTHRDFTIGPKGSTTLKFNGLNTGSSYNVVIQCNDTSGKQTEPIGSVSQAVTF